MQNSRLMMAVAGTLAISVNVICICLVQIYADHHIMLEWISKKIKETGVNHLIFGLKDPDLDRVIDTAKNLFKSLLP